jgi:GNAT superfamily N-acetyltransferase
LRRYVSGLSGPDEPTVAGLLSADAGYSLVVEDDHGRLVALANLRWGNPPEMALLVEEDWRGQRLGTALARRLLTAADAAGLSTVRSVVPVGSAPMVRIMSGLGQRLHREYDGGVLTLIVTV